MATGHLHTWQNREYKNAEPVQNNAEFGKILYFMVKSGSCAIF